MNERIRKVRKALDLTQQEFAERIGMKRNSIALIENGRNTSDQTIFAICREFNVNEQWLRTGEGEMFRILPEEDELSVCIEELLMGTDDSVHKALRAFLLAYGRINDPSKKVVNELIDSWLEEMKKKQD